MSGGIGVGKKCTLEEALKHWLRQESYKDIIQVELAQIEHSYVNGPESARAALEEDIKQRLQACEDINARLYLCSFLFKLTGHEEWLDAMIDSLVSDMALSLSWEIRIQLFGQLSSILSNNAAYQTHERNISMKKMYSGIVKAMTDDIGGKESLIPVAERDRSLVFVITCQYLAMEHGPTKTALDRCSTLIRKLHKKVMLINSGELLNVKNILPLCETVRGNYNDAFLQESMVEYQGLKIPFYQCEHDMPNKEGILEIANLIKQLKPLYMVVIGGDSLLADYLSLLVPSITIGTVPSEVSTTMGQLQVIGRALKEKDSDELRALGKDEKDVIVGRFTSSVPMEKLPVTRQELGISTDWFVCAVVGARLNDEVTPEFVDMMLRVKDKRIKFAFIGKFDEGYERYANEYPDFRDRTINLGFTSNILGYLGQCDLYVNPKRRGGGTSVIEAMHEGLPVVAFDYGDVALGCGNEFFVADYEEMAETIEHYLLDADYYELKSKAARNRADQMLDTDKNFCDIIFSAEQRLGIR